MATLAWELPETYASVTRPVAYEIIKQLRDELGILNKDIPISFPGANGKVTTWNGNTTEERDSAQFQGTEKLIVDIKEEFVEEDLLTMSSRKVDNPPIFLDKDHGIAITPVYSRTKVIINITYRSRDRWQIESFRDYWRRKIAENREYMVFSARYQYPIPENIEKGLYLLHRTREINQPQFERYQDYLFTLGSPHLTSLTNGAGLGDTLAMTECQENIYGFFADPNVIQVEKEELGSVWSCQFDFEYYYDKPISVVLHYPLLINNVLIPPQLYPQVHFDIAKLKAHSSITKENYTIISQDNGFRWHIRGAYIRIPEFDDWSNFLYRNDYKALLSAMLIVESDKPKEVCNLTDLGDWGLHPALHNAFKKQHRYLSLRNEFPFHIAVYENESYLGDECIHTDKDLNVSTKHPMKLDKMYHLVISVTKDIRSLSPEAQRRFFACPELVNAYIDIILGFVPETGYPKLNEDGSVNIKDYERIASMYNMGSRGQYLGLGSALATVGIFSIGAGNMNDINRL